MMIFCSIEETSEKRSNHHKKLRIEEDLFIKIADNDMEAFEELYRITEKSLYAFILSILRNHEDTLDVLQDTYLKIRSAAHLYKPMGKPMAWVFTIARNLSMSKLRTRSRIDSIEVEDIENDLSFSYVTNREDKMVLQAALTILNEREREIILLHAISGFAFHEIAKNLGIPLSTTLSKYHRGLKKLKKYLLDKEVNK
ncbi:RNA polymerase sigma factor [Anaeromicropila herbilytica]|uniref:RNA polymerase sigma factor n=1 Tax=Anaeromicropila herbilytica TaxID=2785025 RepID=A0A7R7IBL1_9FIRM|nr:RNA polymerase sigma factor [Anaeromicropila herbilytica]BCN28924.1 RNA polymerase sigma factor [Anaeromicropila herbilytica]